MKAETPASNIMETGSYSDARSYRVQCSCQSYDHAHDIWIEQDDGLVTTTIYTQTTTDYWTALVPEHWFCGGLINGLARRLRLTWQVWTRGMVEYQASLIMDPQTAINYSQALAQAVDHIKQEKEST